MTRLILALVALIVLVALSTWPRDAEAPEEIGGRVGEFRAALAGQLDLPPSIMRFTGVERGANEFVVVRFELRPFPFVFPEGAYLVSRCTPLPELDPRSMAGGRGVTDWDADEELALLREQSDGPCP